MPRPPERNGANSYEHKETTRKAAAEPQTKFVYVGPTILGVATRNTVYSEKPKGLEAAIKAAPYMAGLCVPISKLADAMAQISRSEGGVYTLYQRALAESATIQKGAN